MGVSSDMGVGIAETLYYSLIILLPTGFFHGMLFTVACAMYNKMAEGAPSSIGKVYFYEMLGTIVGGGAGKLYFHLRLQSFEIAIGVASLNALICLAMQLFTGIHRKISRLSQGLQFSSCRLFSLQEVELTYFIVTLWQDNGKVKRSSPMKTVLPEHCCHQEPGSANVLYGWHPRNDNSRARHKFR